MLTDKELLELYNDPSSRERSLSLLVRQFQKSIYYFIRRMVLDHQDADDLTQNTFIKAWRGMVSFRGESKIATWLHTIAYREAVTFLATKKRLGKVSLEEVEFSLPAALEADKYYSGDEIQRMLQTALATLPEKQKAVFVLKYYEEKKYDEIADITGTSVGALKASFHHAVQKIEAHLAKHL
ncbi:MAG: RNA polymerase sigma factor [Crocinitomicaceae bacterium]|nr:RNA polymerase sigma factor [Crocinitomicaceae bacterium]